MRFPRLFRVRQAPAAPQPRDVLAELREFDRPRSTARWEHVPMTGPYRIWRCDDDDEAQVRGWSTFDELADAIMSFARLHQPRVGQCCMLFDGEDQVVLGWADTHHGEHDLRYQWWGCKLAFHMLSVIEPINAALWEQLAYEGVLSGHS